MKPHPLANAVPVGTTKFLWLLAGPQKQATNDQKFNSAVPIVSQTQKEKDQ